MQRSPSWQSAHRRLQIVGRWLSVRPQPSSASCPPRRRELNRPSPSDGTKSLHAVHSATQPHRQPLNSTVPPPSGAPAPPRRHAHRLKGRGKRAAAATQGAALWRASIALQQQLRASPTLNLGLAALACRPPRAQLSAEPVGEAQLAPRPAARRGAAATSLAHPGAVQRAPPPPRARVNFWGQIIIY